MNNMSIFLNKSENMRKGYINSLEPADVNFKEKWLAHFGFLPAFFEEIYSICNGTKPEIEEQIYFDFLPGFRLMQVDEIMKLHQQEQMFGLEYETTIPFLADYAGCYYGYAKINNKECIVLITEEGIEILHEEISLFWKTVIAFYEEDVYFLDEEGFLSYDFEKEGDIGQKYNAGVKYWN